MVIKASEIQKEDQIFATLRQCHKMLSESYKNQLVMHPVQRTVKDDLFDPLYELFRLMDKTAVEYSQNVFSDY